MYEHGTKNKYPSFIKSSVCYQRLKAASIATEEGTATIADIAADATTAAHDAASAVAVVEAIKK